MSGQKSPLSWLTAGAGEGKERAIYRKWENFKGVGAPEPLSCFLLKESGPGSAALFYSL